MFDIGAEVSKPGAKFAPTDRTAVVVVALGGCLNPPAPKTRKNAPQLLRSIFLGKTYILDDQRYIITEIGSLQGRQPDRELTDRLAATTRFENVAIMPRGQG